MDAAGHENRLNEQVTLIFSSFSRAHTSKKVFFSAAALALVGAAAVVTVVTAAAATPRLFLPRGSRGFFVAANVFCFHIYTWHCSHHTHSLSPSMNP